MLQSTLKVGEKNNIHQYERKLQQYRKTHQPLHQPTCGSLYINPPGESAGKLIEASHLKGTRIGGIQISPKHANFIENEGGATYSDFIEFIEIINEKIKKKYGFTFETEVRL